MKTQCLFLMAAFTIFLAIGETGAQQVRQLKATQFMEFGIPCNNEFEVLAGEIEVHLMVRITKDFYLDWVKEKYITGEAVSQTTGEIFHINYLRKSDGLIPGTKPQRTFHLNMVGDRGTHYIAAITLEYEWIDDVIKTKLIRLKAKCL